MFGVARNKITPSSESYAWSSKTSSSFGAELNSFLMIGHGCLYCFALSFAGITPN
jgi:DNA repair photolyase